MKGTDTYKTYSIDDGLEMKGQYFHNEHNKGVLILPDMAEFKEYYDHLALKLYAKGFSVWSFDPIGQGESEGDFSIMKTAEALRDTVSRVMVRYKLSHFGAFGHGTGALSVAYFASENRDLVDAVSLAAMPENMSGYASRIEMEILKRTPMFLLKAATGAAT